MRRLVLAVVVNLVLGVLAIVPLFLVWYVLSTGPFASLGWTRPEPTENDGMLIWGVLAVALFSGFAALWGLINVFVRRRVTVTASQYWPACVAATLVPFCIILL